jgi:hypothetical protein
MKIALYAPPWCVRPTGALKPVIAAVAMAAIAGLAGGCGTKDAGPPATPPAVVKVSPDAPVDQKIQAVQQDPHIPPGVKTGIVNQIQNGQ